MRRTNFRQVSTGVVLAVLIAGCTSQAVVVEAQPPIGVGQATTEVPTASEPLPPPTTWHVRTRSGIFDLAISPIPDPIPLNEQFKLMVVVTYADRPGELASRARIQLDATMPAHAHGMQRLPRVSKLGDGAFLVEGMLFHMRGRWEIEIAVFSGYRSGQATLVVDVGE